MGMFLNILLICCHLWGRANTIEVRTGWDSGTTESPDVDAKCQELLDKFSESAANFTLCANNNAKPISMCRKCLHNFLDVRTYYDSLSHENEEGEVCRSLLTSQDRVEIISDTYSFIAGSQGLWSRGQCDKCFKPPLSHSSNLTKEAHTFFTKFEDVTKCFKEHPFNKSAELRSEACDECNSLYKNLSIYYRDEVLGKNYPMMEGVCFDVLDAMNLTRKIWGETYHCGRKLVPQIALIVTVCVILMTPVIFYVSVIYMGTSAEVVIVPASNRLRDTLGANPYAAWLNRISMAVSSRRSSTTPASPTTPTTPTTPVPPSPPLLHSDSSPDSDTISRRTF